MKKIKLVCWWTDDESLKNRLINQFVPYDDFNEYEFVTNNDFDYLIVFGRTDFTQYNIPSNKIISFSQEPLWSPNDSKNLHEYSKYVNVSDLNFYSKSENYMECLLPMFYGGRGEFDERKDFYWSKKLRFDDLSLNKNKGISFIVTKNYCSWYDHFNKENSEIIYEKRTKLGELISKKMTDVHIFGTYWENNNVNVFGECWNKRVGLNEYKFSICVENTIQKNYISEKFWDCVLTDTIPIYLGCSNIEDYVPSNCFINLYEYKDSYENMMNVIDQVNNNSYELYEKYIPNLKKLKEDFFTNETFNVWYKIKGIINKIENGK